MKLRLAPAAVSLKSSLRPAAGSTSLGEGRGSGRLGDGMLEF
ncbi:MAG: hypothetical protein AAFX50_08650 [Acidobacteriota bacterium]